ncbi:MAG: hypothetical protein ACR2PL_21205 [Dehalococcoidia bacterium]
MPRAPVIQLPPTSLDAIFDALDVLRKIDEGRFSTEIAATDPSQAIPGGRSLILKHYRSDGTHVATAHVLMDDQGDIRHRHGKDILLGTIKFTRQ